jgi:hypothetical protein
MWTRHDWITLRTTESSPRATRTLTGRPRRCVSDTSSSPPEPLPAGVKRVSNGCRRTGGRGTGVPEQAATSAGRGVRARRPGR